MVLVFFKGIFRLEENDPLFVVIILMPNQVTNQIINVGKFC